MFSSPHTRPPGILRLLLVQSQVIINDNASKLVLIGLAPLVLTAKEADVMTGLVAALLVFPFVLFSPVCGWLADRFPKVQVLRASLWLQLLVTSAVGVALFLNHFNAAAVCFFFMAVQSVLFTPAKQGMIKELVGAEHLNEAVSWVEASTIVAILLGSLIGALLLDSLVRHSGNSWLGASCAVGLLALSCAVALWIFRRMPEQPRQTQECFRWSLLWEHFGFIERLWRQRPLFGAALGIAWFYGFGSFLYLVLVDVGRVVHPGVGAATHAGWQFALLGCGIIAGAILYSRLSGGKVSLESIPISAAVMSAALFGLVWVPLNHGLFDAGLVLFGIASGTFIVPLNAYLQDRARSHERGQMLAAATLLGNGMALGAVGIHFVVNAVGIPLNKQFLGSAVMCAVVAVLVAATQPEGARRFLTLMWLRLWRRYLRRSRS